MAVRWQWQWKPAIDTRWHARQRQRRSPHRVASGGNGGGRRSFPPGAKLNTTGGAPSKHDSPLGNTTESSSPLGDASRGGPHTAGSDGEPKSTRSKQVHPARASAEAEYHPIPAMEATTFHDLGPEGVKKMFYRVDESSLPDVQTSTEIKELRAEKEASDKQYEAAMAGCVCHQPGV